MKLRLPFFIALVAVALPIFAVGKLHKDGVINLEKFPPSIEKEHIDATPEYPS